MDGALIGYFPKRIVRRAEWVSPFPDHPDAAFPVPNPVEEICSASRCIACGPMNWYASEEKNLLGLFDDRRAAWSVVPEAERSRFEIFAYVRSLRIFDDGREELWEDDEILEIEPLPSSFVRLGWDAVEFQPYSSFGCSPLACNGQVDAEGVPPVNRYCLVDSEREAIELARLFSITKPEPGPYGVVEVWRDSESIALD